MRISLMVIIKLYWFLIPKHKRRKCLFKESCSHFVYKTTKSKGLISGVKALNFRINNCNPNYTIMELNDEKVLITKSNNVFKQTELNKHLFKW